MNYWLDISLGWKHKGLLSFMIQLEEGQVTGEQVREAFQEQLGDKADRAFMQYEKGSLSDKLLRISDGGRTALFTYLDALRQKGYVWLQIQRNASAQFESYVYHASSEPVPLWKMYYRLEVIEEHRVQEAYRAMPWAYFILVRDAYTKYLVESGQESNLLDKLVSEYLEDQEPSFFWGYVPVQFEQLNEEQQEISIKYRDYIRAFPHELVPAVQVSEAGEEFIQEKI